MKLSERIRLYLKRKVPVANFFMWLYNEDIKHIYVSKKISNTEANASRISLERETRRDLKNGLIEHIIYERKAVIIDERKLPGEDATLITAHSKFLVGPLIDIINKK